MSISDGVWHSVSWNFISSLLTVTVDAIFTSSIPATTMPHNERNDQAMLYLGARPLYPGNESQ